MKMLINFKIRRFISKLIYVIVLLFFITGCNTGYENTGNYVYYNHWNEAVGSIKDLINADPATFAVLKNDDYAKDNKTVFYEGHVMKNADAASFESLDEYYARDKNNGYYGDSAIVSSRGKTFSVIDGYYSTDGVDIFYMYSPLKVKSAKDFKIVHEDSGFERWGTDGYYYYFRNYKVPSDDYKNVTFFKGSGGLAKDTRWVYFMGNKINYDVDGKKVMDTVDIASFKVTGYLNCEDKLGCINPYHGREQCVRK